MAITKEEFISKATAGLNRVKVLRNPGRGMTTIKSVTHEEIAYIRAQITIYVGFDSLYNAYQKYEGKEVSSRELKENDPDVFDSNENGHNCNCTFLFMLLQLKELGLVNKIWGSGVRGNPFYVYINGDSNEDERNKNYSGSKFDDSLMSIFNFKR